MPWQPLARIGCPIWTTSTAAHIITSEPFTSQVQAIVQGAMPRPEGTFTGLTMLGCERETLVCRPPPRTLSKHSLPPVQLFVPERPLLHGMAEADQSL